MKKYCILFLLIFCLTGCNAQEKEKVASVPDGTCQVILTVADTNEVLLDTKIDLQSGDTVFSVLERAAETTTNCPIVYEGTGKSAFVTKIGDYANGANGAASGWVFLVNQETVFTSAGSTEVKNGDVVTWKYITSFTEF